MKNNGSCLKQRNGESRILAELIVEHIEKSAR